MSKVIVLFCVSLIFLSCIRNNSENQQNTENTVVYTEIAVIETGDLSVFEETILKEVVIDNEEVIFPRESYFPQQNIYRIFASSESKQRYSIENLIDGTSLSWSPSSEGNGVGKFFTIEFDLPVKLRGFLIKNGHGQLDYFGRFNRVKSFEVFFDDNPDGVIVNIEDDHDWRFYQFTNTESFDDYIGASKITFMINEIHPGTQYDNTFIAEIYLMAPVLRSYNRWGWNQINRSTIVEEFIPDSYTVNLLRTMYEMAGVNTRLDTNGILQIFSHCVWDCCTPHWFVPPLRLSGYFAGRGISGTGGGGWALNYQIFISFDSSHILLKINSGTDGVRGWAYLDNPKLFRNNNWEAHNYEASILPILKLKEEIEIRELSSRFSFSGKNCLTLNAWDNTISSWNDAFAIVETHRFVWNGTAFEPAALTTNAWDEAFRVRTLSEFVWNGTAFEPTALTTNAWDEASRVWTINEFVWDGTVFEPTTLTTITLDARSRVQATHRFVWNGTIFEMIND